jgi:aspartate-semialdehyde dehydrogenase
MSFHPSTPLPVAVLGATSLLGQHLVARLATHPWFKLVAVTEPGMGPGAHATRCWYPPASAAPVSCLSLPLLPCDPAAFPGVKIIFSALSTPDASKIEAACAEAGMAVLCTTGHERFSPDVPMLLPEINPGHAAALPLQRKQRGWLGCLVTNASHTATSLALVLKPLQDAFGLEQVAVATLPGTSNLSHARRSDLEHLDNTAPFLPDEEAHIAREARRLLGPFDDELGFLPSPVCISMHRHCDAPSDEQILWVKVRLACQATREDLLVAWDLGSTQRKVLDLPSAPPRTLLDRSIGTPRHMWLDDRANQEMALHISRLRACSRLDFTFVVLSQRTMSTVATRAILQAEYLLREGYLDDLDWSSGRKTRKSTVRRKFPGGGRCA